MSPFIKELAEELGKTPEELEGVWKEGKKLTAETFGISEDEFTKREIEYTKEIVREMLGLKREISVSDFINSDKTARDFIDETMTSGSLGIDRAVNRKTKPYDDEDEDESEEGCDSDHDYDENTESETQEDSTEEINEVENSTLVRTRDLEIGDKVRYAIPTGGTANGTIIEIISGVMYKVELEDGMDISAKAEELSKI